MSPTWRSDTSWAAGSRKRKKAGNGYDDDVVNVAEVAVTSRVDVRRKLVAGGRRAERRSSVDHYARHSAAADFHSSSARTINLTYLNPTAARSMIGYWHVSRSRHCNDERGNLHVKI